ncbi:TetR/AcrR family transcriptional regulator [Nonomuraea rubra]
MNTVPPSRQERRKTRSREIVLAAAERLFLERGFQATTLEDVAQAADLAVRTLYVHFGGKPGLYTALIDRALELDARYCDEGWDTGTDPVGRLVGLADGYLRFYRDHPGYFRLFRFPPPDASGAEGVTDAAERVGRRIASEIDRMAAALAQAIDQQIIRPVPPRPTAVFLWAAWDGIIACHLLPGHMGLSEAAFESVLAQARDIVMTGLLPARTP